MIRIVQNLPNKFFKSFYGGAYRANRQSLSESKKQKHQDELDSSPKGRAVTASSFHTSNRSEALGNHDDRDWKKEWEKSFKQRHEWDSFRRAHYIHEAVSWGSLLVLGIHFGRYIGKGARSDDQCRKRESVKWACLYHALPGCRAAASKRSILPEEDEEEVGSRESLISAKSSSSENHSDGSEDGVEWDHEPFGIFQSKWPPWSASSTFSSATNPTIIPSKISSSAAPSATSSTSTISPSQATSISSSVAPSESSISSTASSSSASSQSGVLSPEDEFKLTLDQVTQKCWGQVNNMLGGHLMSEGAEEKAFDHFRKASEAGYSKGQYNLGMCYELGRGVLQDEAQAAICYALAAKQDHSLAQYKLGSYHLEGRGGVKKCQKTAITLITQAAQGGVTQAHSYLGMYYMTDEAEDPKRAVMHLGEAALKKDTEAEYHLGLCCEYGWGMEQNTAKAASLYHAAAKKNHAPALYALGLFYQQGLGGLPMNELQARELLIKASSQGYEKATEKLLELDSASTDGSILFDFLDSIRKTDSNSSLDSLVSFRSSVSSEACSDLVEESSKGTMKQGTLHASCSAPELTAAQKTDINANMATVDGAVDGDGMQNSLLHSLSCLTLMFPQLNDGWSVWSPQEQRDWIRNGSSSEQDQDLFSDRPGPSASPVRFQLGGLNEEDGEEGLDWCEPIDAIAHQRLVSFNRRAAAAVL